MITSINLKKKDDKLCANEANFMFFIQTYTFLCPQMPLVFVLVKLKKKTEMSLKTDGIYAV